MLHRLAWRSSTAIFSSGSPKIVENRFPGKPDLLENPSIRPWLQKEPGRKIVERLKVLKAGWISSDGPVCEDWFHQGGSKELVLGRLREGLAQAWLQEVPLPPDLPEAVLAEEFDFSACMNRFGLDWERAKMAASHKRKTGAGAGSCSRLRSSFHRCSTVPPEPVPVLQIGNAVWGGG